MIDVAGRWALWAAAVVWATAATGRLIGTHLVVLPLVVSVLLMGVGAVAHGRAVTAALLLATAGVVSGWSSSLREMDTLEASAPSGRVSVMGRALTDTMPGERWGSFLLEPAAIGNADSLSPWNGPKVLVVSSLEVQAGDELLVEGTASATSGWARGDPYSWRLRARRVEFRRQDAGVLGLANAVRSRVAATVNDGYPEGALLSGFLIGDTGGLGAADLDALRKSGLSHFVAVSGSNVALFLGLWWLITAPMAFGPRRRALAGLAGLGLFVLVTRWEPSVLRAATMAAVLLVSRAFNLAVGTWTALGAAVASLILVSGELVGDVGFQLSVAATAGVLIGGRLHKSGALGAAARVTVGAQAAVAPLLLLHFGTVPLAAPITNLISAPFVAVSTLSGMVGVLTSWAPAVQIAEGAAALVLRTAQAAAGLPQLGPLSSLVVVVLIVVALRPSVWRVPARAGIALTLMLTIWPGGPPAPGVWFLDVGQGDSVLLVGNGGAAVLIDGGPDPQVLLSKLDDLNVTRLDLVVVSHPHEDHVAGLVAVIERLDVGELWHSGFPDPGETFESLVTMANDRGVPVRVPRRGDGYTVGDVHLAVLGPIRRYASPNDHSLVLLARLGSLTVALPGDVEEIAQSELGPLKADVLKVPHQGAATSDFEWLAASAGSIAVVSVGPNNFGHPSEEVITALEQAGARVLRTDELGDVFIPLTEGAGPD